MNSLKAFWMRRFLLPHKIWEAGGGTIFPLPPVPPRFRRPCHHGSYPLVSRRSSSIRELMSHIDETKRRKRERKKNMENTFSDCEVMWNMKIRVRKNICSRPKKTAIIFFLLWHDFFGGWFNLADTICCFINKLYPTNHSDIMSQTIINVGLARKDWNE